MIRLDFIERRIDGQTHVHNLLAARLKSTAGGWIDWLRNFAANIRHGSFISGVGNRNR